MLKAMGGWLLLDGIGSIILYYSTQTWRKDHWLRVVRALIGLYLIVWG